MVSLRDANNVNLVCKVCGWHPGTLIIADLALNKIPIRRLKHGYAYICNACKQDLQGFFDEKRRHGPT